jgi:hypothetical protein
MPKPTLIVGVTGGRTFAGYLTIQKALTKVSRHFDITVVHGYCPDGADALAKVWCERTGTPQKPFPAKWKEFGDAAGFVRNTQMVEEAGIQLLLSFPGENGTRDMTNKCLTAGIPVKLIEAHPNDRPQRVEVTAAEAAA